MSLFSKIEKVTRDVTISHFFLMFGYKLFSLYFPLFLVARGMSLPEVGFIYLLIYLPIVIFSPIVGFLNHKANPAVLATSGAIGYGAYVLGMILIPIYQIWWGVGLFYLWQILLGISSALFYVSMKAILMGYPNKNPDQAFGWFYSAPSYAIIFAPIVGALFIWKFGFNGVFIFSLIIFFLTALFCLFKLREPARILPDQGFKITDSKQNYQRVFQTIKRRDILPLIITAFSVLLLIGFYRAFFVLFLRNELFWSQNLILIFVSISSFLFLPISLLLITRVLKERRVEKKAEPSLIIRVLKERRVEKKAEPSLITRVLKERRVEKKAELSLIKRLRKPQNKENIFQGGVAVGSFSILFGAIMPVLNFLSILTINLGRSAGALICDASRSGLISRNSKTEPEEASTLDTILAPLGTALGALISGAIIGFLGFQFLFIVGGVFVVVVAFFAKGFAKIGNTG